MGTSLTGLEIKDTYGGLIKTTDNGALTSLKVLTDGLGNDSTLSLSTTAASIAGTLAVSGDFSIADKIVHIGDTNTAIRFPAADTITFETSGAEATRITSTGNVGIGTSAPNHKLDVNGVVGGFQAGQTAYKTYTKLEGFQISAYQSVNGAPYTKTTDVVANADSNVSSELRVLVAASGSNPAEVARFTSNGLTFNGDTAAANALDDYEEGTFTPTFSGATFTHQIQTGFYTKIGRQVSIFIDVEATYTSATGTFACTLPFSVLANSRGEGVVRPITGVTFTNYVTCEAVGSSIFFENCNSSTGQASTDMNSTNFNAAGFRLFASVTYFV